MFLIGLYCCQLCSHNLFKIQLSYDSYWICEVCVHVFVCVCMHASKMSCVVYLTPLRGSNFGCQDTTFHNQVKYSVL